MNKNNSLLNFIKNEAVLCIAIFLALVSMFFVKPDKNYVKYIDFKTLGILFCLMAVVSGLKEIGVFDWFAGKILMKVKKMWQLIILLVFLCFFFSMIITNDVALITFVPLSITILEKIGEKYKERWIITVVVMQTIGANLGSMLTPIGNPQNLYLYGKTGMSIVDFIGLMLPYTILALVLLVVWIVLSVSLNKNSNDKSTIIGFNNGDMKKISDVRKLVCYLLLFFVCIMAVAHFISFLIPLIMIIIFMAAADRKIFKKVDYSLLVTFIGFFVFIGNLGRIEVFNEFLSDIIKGNEIMTAIISSQVMSNVPAALLLSGFSDKYNLLIIGTNIGGLGTLIASMASLISFKYITRENKKLTIRYMILFTAANIIFAIAEISLILILK